MAPDWFDDENVQVISHCERNIHQHVPKIIEVISRGATDSDAKVRENSALIADWLTILAQPDLVLKIVLPGMEGFSMGTLLTIEKFCKNVNSTQLIGKVVKRMRKAVFCYGL